MKQTSLATVAAVLALSACSNTDSPAEPSPPPPLPVHTVSLAPPAINIAVGSTAQLAFSAKDAAGRALSGRTPTWTTSNPMRATVSANGLVTGVSAGDVTITATIEGKSADAVVQVQTPPPAAVASITLTPQSPKVRQGDTLTLTAVVRDAQNNVLSDRTLRWHSSDTLVAVIDSISGRVTALDGGSTEISATSEGVAGLAALVVQLPVHSITIATVADTVEAWDEIQHHAVLHDVNGDLILDRQVTWSVSDPLIATIGAASGAFTGTERGRVSVRAASEGVESSVEHEIVIRYRSVVAGTMHACDIASGGAVWCWGLNGSEGRIGSPILGANSFSSIPVKVAGTGPNGTRFVSISSYASFTCGISTELRAWCWGYNGWGQLGIPSSTQSSSVPVPVSGNHTFSQVSVGGEHSCALTPDGRAYCWGRNDWRQFAANAPASSSTPIAVWPEQRFSRITAGSNFTCATTIAGKSYCWGGSGLGQLGNGAPLSYGNTFSAVPVEVAGGLTFTDIAAANNYACGVTQGGAYCWGANGGRLGNGVTIESSAPAAVAGGIAFRSVSPGNAHSCGVAFDYSLWCWGSNGNGRLGTVLLNGSTVPVRSGGNLLAAEVAASGIATGSGSHTCAISADRLTVYCFGRNDVGQLGNSQTTSAAAENSTPTVVTGQRPR